MEFRGDVSFDLKGFSPTGLCALPGQGCLLAVGASGGLRSLDLVSGTQLLDTEMAPIPGSPLLCQYHGQSGKLVVGSGGMLGVRGPTGGSLMLHSILQPAAEDPESVVSIELPLAEAEILWSELQGFVLPRNSAQSTGGVVGSKQWSTRLASVIAQLARGVRMARERDGACTGHKWKTVSFEGPVHQLFSLFNDLLSKMRAPRGGAAAPFGSHHSAGSSVATTPSPTLPIVAAICLRLQLLHPDHHAPLQHLQQGREVRDNKMVFSEAVRKLSLQNWPHKNYIWAVPSAMAAAGFFHLANNTHLPSSGIYKADRVSCFACHVYLYSWEPNDEPWSEHERHAMQCPFMRGDHTENVPLEVTEGTHPAVRVTSDRTDSIAFIAVSLQSGLVAVATKQGVLSVWDIGGSLCILPRARLELKREALQSLLHAHSPAGTQQEEVAALSLTSLSLLTSPGTSTPLLATAVTVHCLSGSSHSLLLLHTVVNVPPSQTSAAATAAAKGGAPPIPPHDPVEVDVTPSLPDDIPFISSLPSAPLPLPPLPPLPSTTSLHDLLADPTDASMGVAGGALHFHSLLPVSSLLPDLHGNLLVQLMHPLPSSRLLAVYVKRTKPHPPSSTEVKSDVDESSTDEMQQSPNSVEVKGQDDEHPHGCLMLLRYSEDEEGKVCVDPVPVVRLVSVCSEDVIVDMCHVEVETKEACVVKETREVMVVITAKGELQLLDVESLQVMTSHTVSGGCGFSTCTAWGAHGGWVATATPEGRVEVVRVCDVGGGDGGVVTAEEQSSEDANLEHSLLTQRLSPTMLDQLISLTRTSPVGVAYSCSAPQHWQEISLQQFHRKVPTHMHSAPGCGESHTPNDLTRVWQYHPPPTVNNRANEINSNFAFELSLEPGCPALGCVSVRLSLPSPHCLGEAASISLLLPPTREEGRRSRGQGRWGQHSGADLGDGARVLCGPMRLKPLVDVTGCAVQVSFTHPLLLSSPHPLTLALRLEQLFPADYTEAAKSAAEAHAQSSVKAGSLRRRGCIVRHGGATRRLQQQTNTKLRAVPEQCYLSLCLYPVPSLGVQPAMDTLLQVMEKREFLLNLTLGACVYRVTRREYDVLQPSLQAVVDGGAGRGGERGLSDGPAAGDGGEGGARVQLQCLQLLCWVATVLDGMSSKDGIETLRGVVGQVLVSLLHACFFARGSRQTAHHCSRLIICLHRPHELSPSVEDFNCCLLCALPPLLPLLPLCSSAACVHWFLRVVSVVAVGSHDCHVISQCCLELLVELARQLQTKSTTLSQLLHTHYGQDGSVLEDSLFDIYLSYYQKSVSVALPHKPHSMTGPPPPPPLPPSFVPPSGSTMSFSSLGGLLESFTSFPHPKLPSMDPDLPTQHPPPPSLAAVTTQPGYQVVFAEKRTQTIYDAELKLLLCPPPTTPEQVRSTLAEFPPFQHGSFLLYGQRGLLETYPLEYTCCSVTGNATVQEPVYRNVNSLSSTGPVVPPVPQVDLSNMAKSSGYFYPTGTNRNSSGIHRTPSAGCRSPQLYPNELSSSETFPKELVMYIDMLQSGQVYSAVLRFNQSVLLTDLSVSTNSSMGCVSVDVWGGGGEGEAVRVAQCTEIQERNLMLGSLTPPPLCQFVKVTYTGKLGASREKAQALLGAFYGIPLMSTSPHRSATTPSKPATLHPLEQQLLSEYCSAREKLTASLIASPAHSEEHTTLPKHSQDSVRERYRACFLAQTRLARLRHYMHTVGSEGGAPVIGGVFSVEEAAAEVDLTCLSLSQLYRLSGCLVNILLVLCGPREGELASRPAFTVSVPTEQLPVVSERDCQLLLSSLGIHGALRTQARVCGLLLRLCAAQRWWGDMVTMTATSLYASNQPHIFNKERALLQFSALCQRSYQHGPVLTCLLHSLSSLLSPLLTSSPSSSPSPPSTASVDQHQLQWMVLLLSHTLSSLSPAERNSNLFGPTFTAPSSQTTSQIKPALQAAREKRSASSSRLGLRPRLRQTLTPASQQPPLPVRSPLLPTLPFPLTHDVARGLLSYIHSLIDQRAWLMLPVVCKALSLLAELSSHPLPLTSILISSQLTLLLSTACTPLPRYHGSSAPGNCSPTDVLGTQQWACRAIQWMVMSLLYHGDVVPHLKQRRRERREGEEGMVGCVEETDLPMKEEVEVLGRGEGEEGEGKEKVEEGVLTEKLPSTKSVMEGSVEVKPLPLHPLLQEWDMPMGQYGEQEYELMNLMTGQEPMFPSISVLPLTLQSEDNFFDPLVLPPVGMTTTGSIVSSEFIPLSMAPPPLPVGTPVSMATPLPLPPKVSKPKKKLSKHHVKSHKYAPGDYTEVPIIRPAQDSAEATASSVNPYRLFVISSAIDHRLQHSVELSGEVAMQSIARAQYEAVLGAMVTAAATGPMEEAGKEGEGEVWSRGEVGLEGVCRCVRGSLNQLLVSVTGSQETVDLVRVLQLWSELNALLPPPPPSGRPSGGPSGGGSSGNSHSIPEPPQSEGEPLYSFCSPELLLSLTQCLCHAPSRAATWQVGLSLVRQVICRLSPPHTPSIPLHPSQLSRLLLAYFLSGKDNLEMVVAEGVLLDLFGEIAPLSLVGSSVSGEGGDVTRECEDVKGAHVLLEVLVELLEQHTSLLDSPLLYPLLEALGNSEIPRLLFPAARTQCATTVACIHKLLVVTVSLVHSTRHAGPWHNVLLYAADMDGDRTRYRRNATGSRLKWVPVPHGQVDSTHRLKVTSDLVQLVRQLVSVSNDNVPECVHDVIQEFIRENGNERYNTPSPSPSLPLTTLVFNDSSLLSEYVALLNTVTKAPHTRTPLSGKPPPHPSAPQAFNLPGSLFVNFVNFLYSQCPDHTRFFRPVLEVLGSAGGEVVFSDTFLSFVSRLTSDLAQEDNQDQLDQFISDGGARLVFECFVRSCQTSVSPSVASSGSLGDTILNVGQQSTPKPFQEGSQLVNYLPVAKLCLSPDRTPVQDLQAPSQGDPPSRSSAFHHTFLLGERELVLTATLPHPILFSSLQLFQPIGSLQNGPSSILIETSSQPDLALPIPATPTISTKGLSCIKVELQSPVIAQEVKVHFYRPAVSDSISLSHLYMLGMGYGGPRGENDEKKAADVQKDPHLCSSWLAILDRWLRLPPASQQRLLQEAARVPQLLPTCLSLISTHQNTLTSTSSRQLLRLLLALASHYPDYGQTLIQHLMGFSSKATPTATPTAVELFHRLCVSSTEHNMLRDRLTLCLRLLSSMTYSHSTSLPVLVRALSSAVWHGDSQQILTLVSEDLFSSLAEVAVSSPMDSPLKPPLNSLLCAVCSHTPHLFTLLLDRSFTALTAASSPHLPPDLPPLLFTLAHTAQSPACSPLLLSSLLLTSVMAELCENFAKFALWVSERQTGPAEESNNTTTDSCTALLPRSCTLLAFLTDFSRNWTPAKAWLGSTQQRALWPPLLQFLSLAADHLPSISPLELSFVQDVGTEFFQAVVQGSTDNKSLFSRLLTNAIYGSYSLEKTTQPPVAAAALTAYAYRLIVDVVLDSEPLPVLIECSTGDSSLANLSLPLTYMSAVFHPSLPVSQNSYLLSLPPCVPTSHVTALCQAQTHSENEQTKARGHSAEPGCPGTYEQFQNDLEHKKSHLFQPSMQRSKKSEPRSILKPTSKAPCVSLSLSSSLDNHISPQTKLSELLASISSPLYALSLSLHVSKPSSAADDKKEPSPSETTSTFSPLPPPPSLLEAFAGSGGLLPLSLCLPSLYPHLWPSGEEDSTEKPFSSSVPSPFTLTSTPNLLSRHALITFGLCLRLRCYADVLMEHLPTARILLLMLMGAEYKEPSSVVSEQLPFVPYILLLRVLRDHPAHEEVGVACRESVMREGVLHQVLATLSTFGHPSRTRPSNTHQSTESSGSSQSVLRPDHGVTSGHRLYWAKGTGFGTGSTMSAWNVDVMRAKQKWEEKQVCLCFSILCEYLSVAEGCGQGAESWCGPALTDLLAGSCLLPAMTAYLVNDSILDISKRADLFQAALGLLYALTLHPSLLPLLTLPVFSEGEAATGRDGLTLFTLSKKLENTVLSYFHTAKTTRVKTKADASNKNTPTATPTSLPSPVPPHRVKVHVNTTNSSAEETQSPAAEAELTELTSAMLATAERVVTSVREGRGEGGEGEGEGENQTTADAYIQTMRPLLFDTFQFVEEDVTGRPHFLVPFYYESRLQSSTAAVYGAARARRLAQEVSALATSLPLSSSSSVFVRCDEDRLDVMKVLITGPSETPYANGCFEFDVFFPAEYPRSPMLVTLMTTGQGSVRFNPNLYNDGKVCLSVLNTWHGRPEEKWNSETSSFLQVLVSIQSLVLVPDPYFNEPGYEQYRGTPYGDQKSLTYNANLYIATVQWAMLHQLQNPSPCFKEVILQHFLLRRVEVMTQCQQWETSLVEGIERMQARGVATTHLKEYLRKLVKGVEALRVELGKIEKRLSRMADKTAPDPSSLETDSGCPELHNSNTGHPVLIDAGPSSNAGQPSTGHPCSMDPSSSAGHLVSVDANSNSNAGHPSSHPTGHPVSIDDNPILNAGHPTTNDANTTGHPNSSDTNPCPNADHPSSLDANSSSNVGHPISVVANPSSNTGHPDKSAPTAGDPASHGNQFVDDSQSSTQDAGGGSTQPTSLPQPQSAAGETGVDEPRVMGVQEQWGSGTSEVREDSATPLQHCCTSPGEGSSPQDHEQ